MRRRDVPIALLASTAGPWLIGCRAQLSTETTQAATGQAPAIASAASSSASDPASSSAPPPPTDAQSSSLPSYPQTPAELAANTTPVSTAYPPGNVFRFCTATQIANIQNNVAQDVSGPIQNTVDSTTGDVFFPSGFYYVGKPLYIPPNAVQNIRLLGESRTSTYIQPLSESIADSSGVNALIINQQTNGKFSLSRLRLSSQIAPYTGICISAVAGGAGSQQIIFSGSIDDCWFDTGSTNSGFFEGGLMNYRVSNCTFEFQKGCFNFVSPTSDVIFSNIVLSNCYDYFVQQNTSPGINIMSVDTLHAYTHNRGILFVLNNCTSLLIRDVQLQASTGVANLGDVGIGSFTDCSAIELTNLNVITSATLGTGATATQLKFTGCSGHVSDSTFDGCDTGIALAGGTSRLSFDHVDISNFGTAALRTVAAPTSGVITADHCDWSDGQLNLVLFEVEAAADFFFSNCRMMNAGLNAGGLQVNYAPSSSGTVIGKDCIIGRNNTSAAAAYYVGAAGTGKSILVNPVFVGTPPGGIQNPDTGQVTIIIGDVMV